MQLLPWLRYAKSSFTSDQGTDRINPQHLKANVTSNQARRASNDLDLVSIASTFTPASDSPPGHARAVNLTADPR